MNDKEQRQYELMIRQVEVTASMVQYLYEILITYSKEGTNLYSVAYLLDLMCANLMSYYGGESELIEQIRARAKEEVTKFQNSNIPNNVRNKELDSLEKTTEELKKMGINFKVLYDPVSKQTTPNIDLTKFMTPEKIDKWIREHMNEVLDAYLDRKKKTKKDNKN